MNISLCGWCKEVNTSLSRTENLTTAPTSFSRSLVAILTEMWKRVAVLKKYTDKYIGEKGVNECRPIHLGTNILQVLSLEI